MQQEERKGKEATSEKYGRKGDFSVDILKKMKPKLPHLENLLLTATTPYERTLGLLGLADKMSNLSLLIKRLSF